MDKMAKKKAEAKQLKTTVKSYQQDIDAEKQKMAAYSQKMETNVRSLQANFRKCAKDMKNAALQMREDGIKQMHQKVHKYKGDIKDQIVENKEAVVRIENGVKLFQSEFNKKSKDFRAYARGPFRNYIKAFWG